MTASTDIPVARKEANKGDGVSAASVVVTADTTPQVITDDDELLRYGVVRVPLCAARRINDNDDESKQHGNIMLDDQQDAVKRPSFSIDLDFWATELAQVTPAILADQGDGEYAFYRNILQEEPPLDFPFDDILRNSPVGEALKRHFNISIAPPTPAPAPPPKHLVDNANRDDQEHRATITSVDDNIRLDDAFCVHYNTLQQDSSGARHMDPCDITVNICLQASDDMQGSQVMFHGRQALFSSNMLLQRQLSTTTTTTTTTTLNGPPAAHKTTVDEGKEQDDAFTAADDIGFSFLVQQIPGTATIHWGHHPHQTLPITAGTRTNVVMTYCYSDPCSRRRSGDATTRTCYG